MVCGSAESVVTHRPSAHVPAHDTPQAPQLWSSVCSSTQTPPQRVAVAQLHAPASQLGVGCAHAVETSQAPSALQVSGASPLQPTAPGVQSPVHAPFTHAWLLQSDGALQAPPSHASTALPAHCVAPAAQIPTQAPFSQVWPLHGTGVPHCAAAVHVCTAFPEHSFAFGAQTPHGPFTQL